MSMESMTPNDVFAFEVSVKGTEWSQIINARSRGKAMSMFHRQVTEPWPSVPYTAMRARKLGAVHTSERFRQNAAYRGMDGVECGRRVRVGEARGVIVGHNASANFDVLFDEDSPRYAGMQLNVHPGEIELEPQAQP